MPHTKPDHTEEVVADPTAEEIAAARTLAVNATHPASWVWNESAVSYLPPSNPPDKNQSYMWDEDREEWIAYSG